MTESFQKDFDKALKQINRSIRELKAEFGEDDNLVAREQFKKLLSTSAILSAKQKSKKAHPLSMSRIAEPRRSRVFTEWTEKFPELTKLMLTKVLDFTLVEMVKTAFSGERSATIAAFEFLVNDNSWSKRAETRESVKLGIVNLKFIDKELTISKKVRKDMDTDFCNLNHTSTKLTFKLDIDPEPKNLLIQIKYIQTKDGSSDELGAFLKTFLSTCFVKYFTGSDFDYEEDMRQLRHLP